jgi:cytochrome c553
MPNTPTPSSRPSATASRKNSVQMTQVAAKLNDREIKAVSDYIAGLR